MAPRQRITDALRSSSDRGIAVAIAPAGFGKSSALQDAYPDGKWVQLSPSDCSFDTVIRTLVLLVAPNLNSALGDLLSRPVTPDSRVHLIEWVAEAVRASQSLVVLEDFHNFSDDVVDVLRTIILQTLPHVRWVISSRESPNLPIGTWIAQDQMMMPLTPEELSFSAADGLALAEAMGVALDAETVAELVRDVQGWPLGVRLSLASWAQLKVRPLIQIKTRAYLFDFLETTIWNQFSEADRVLLEVIAAIGGTQPAGIDLSRVIDHASPIDQLQRRLPLISISESGAYRLHDLFSEFILQRSTQSALQMSNMIERVGRLYEDRDLSLEALSLYLAYERWDLALALLGEVGPHLLYRGYRGRIIEAVGRFPRSQREQPVLIAIRALLLSQDGAYEAASRESERALAFEIPLELRAKVSLEFAGISRSIGDPARAASIARSLLNDTRYGNEIRSIASASLCLSHAILGNREAALAAVPKNGQSELLPDTRATIHSTLAYAYLVLGLADEARGEIRPLLSLVEMYGWPGIAMRAWGLISNLAYNEDYDPDEVRRANEQCLHYAQLAGDSAYVGFALLQTLIYGIETGDLTLIEESRRLLVQNGVGPVDSTRAFRYVYDSWALCLVNDVPGALSCLDRVPLEKFASNSVFLIMAVRLALLAASNKTRALDEIEFVLSMRRSLEDTSVLTRLERFYGSVFLLLALWFLHYRPIELQSTQEDVINFTCFPLEVDIANAARSICSFNRATITSTDLEGALTGLGRRQAGVGMIFRTLVAESARSVKLTENELTVLRAYARGESNEQIAHHMSRSVWTVKDYAKSIFTKLNVSKRSAAIAAARELGLLGATDPGWAAGHGMGDVKVSSG